jgi:hypothetical protein
MIDFKTRKGSIMTQKEFFESIMNSDVITEEMRTHAADELAKIEARAEKRKTTRNSKNDGLKEAILACFVEGTPMMGKEVAATFEITPQKANAILKQMTEDGLLVVSQVANGKRLINSYTLPTA